MKRILLTFLLGLLPAQPVSATLITFDDLTAADVIYTGGQIPQGYGGLGWNNFYWGESTGNGSAGSSGQSGFTSGLQPFTLNGAYLTGSALDSKVEVRGVSLGFVLYDEILVLSTEPTWIAFNYVGINSVFFATPGQFGNPSGSAGLHFGMDNLVINESTGAIPEPGTCFAGALLLLPLAASTFWKLRQAM